MISAKLLFATLALTLLPKACGSKDEPADAAPATVETAATPTATDDTETAPSATTTTTAAKPTTVKPTAKDAAAGDAAVVADAGPAKTDAGAVAADAGAKKGFLPPKIDAPADGNKDEKGVAFGHFDQAVIVSKVHTRDPLLEACYKATGKEPGEWDTRCYDMAFTPAGIVTAATTRSTDALGNCTKAALTGILLGAPKDKAAGQARVCLSTR